MSTDAQHEKMNRRTLIKSLGLTGAAVVSGGLLSSLETEAAGNSPFDLIGNLAELQTKNKNNLVQSVNEMHNQSLLCAETGGRSKVTYRDANAVRVSGKGFVMSGFRFQGVYYKGLVPYAVLDPSKNTASLNTDLGCQTAKDFSQWYAVFAVYNEGDAYCTYKIMPYLRCRSVSGNTIELGEAGETAINIPSNGYEWVRERPYSVNDIMNSNGNVYTCTVAGISGTVAPTHTSGAAPDGTVVWTYTGAKTPISAKMYNMNANVLAGVDVLIINETIDNRANSFSGRTAKAISNTSSSVTVDDAGTIGEKDYFLPAPPQFQHYRYLGTFYLDTHEVRNIADTGSIVKYRGITGWGNINNGLGTSGTYVYVNGIIPPLATAVIGNLKQSLSTTSTGVCYVSVGMDHVHDYDTYVNNKDVASTVNFYDSGIIAPFIFSQRVNLRSAGNLGNVPIRQFDVRGWIEP